MRWIKVEFCVPIPCLALSPRFSLRSLLFSVVIVAVALLYYQPKRVTSRPIMLAPAPAGATPSHAQLNGNTQLALLLSPFVIGSAVRRPGIMQTELLRDRHNPIEWIRSHLSVRSSGRKGVVAARLTIVARQGTAAEMERLLAAIADAYQQEILAAPSTAVP